MRPKHHPSPTAAPRPSAPVPAVVATTALGCAEAAELSGAAGLALTSGYIRCATTKNQGDAAMQAGFRKTDRGVETSLQVFF